MVSEHLLMRMVGIDLTRMECKVALLFQVRNFAFRIDLTRMECKVSAFSRESKRELV